MTMNRSVGAALTFGAFGLLFWLLASASPAKADTAIVVSACGTPPTTYTAGQNRPTTMDTNGNLCGVTGTSATPDQVVGNVASGATDSGNPVKVGCKNNTTKPTYTDGQRTDCQSDTRGNIQVSLWDQNGNSGASVSTSGADGISSSSNALLTKSFGYVFDGTSSMDKAREVANSTNSVGTGITAAGLVGQCDDTTPTALTENSFGNIRIDCTTHALITQGQCASFASISVTAGNTTQIIALSGTTTVRVCNITLSTSLTGSFTMLSGTGSNCATPANSSGAIPITTATPYTIGDGAAPIYRGSAGGEFCVTAVTGNVTGYMMYTQL